MATIRAEVKCPWCGKTIDAELTPWMQAQGFINTHCEHCGHAVKIIPKVYYIAEKYRINEELGILGE